MRRPFASARAICFGLALGLSPVAASSVLAALSPEYSIRNVQQALNTLGYTAGTADGKMGAKTRTAISAYQRDNGLAPTGAPSAELYDRLLASVSSGARPQPAYAQPAAYGQPPYDGRVSADLVTAVQSELRQRGYTIPVVSGQLDGATRDAIMQYQTDAGMTVSGQPSETLLTHLRSASMQRTGIDRRQVVSAIQDELNRRGYDAGPPDGALGPKSRTAIRTYQSDAGLPITGEPSESLLASLRNQGGPRMARGDRDRMDRDRMDRVGEPADRGLVRDIQAELRDRRLYDGPVNGNLNGRTRDAIRAYESAMRMPETGMPSVDLLASLRISDRARNEARQFEPPRPLPYR